MSDSSVGVREVNCSLRTRPAIIHGMVPSIRCQPRSSRFAVVVPQDATESLAASDLTGCTSDFLTQVDQSIVEPPGDCVLRDLMDHKSDNGRMQRSLPEKDHALQALLLY